MHSKSKARMIVNKAAKIKMISPFTVPKKR
jgi:hypothetical protein